MPLFSKSHKNPAEIVKILKENMAILEKQEKKTDKASEEVSKSLQAMKEILCGTTDKEPPTEVVAQLAQELYNSGLLVTLIANLQLIDFEGKKDVSQIFNNILRRQIGTRSPTVEYISAHPHILFMLLKGHSSSTLKEKIQVKKKTMPLFSKSHKNPAEIVKILKENMAILEKQEKKTDKALWAH